MSVTSYIDNENHCMVRSVVGKLTLDTVKEGMAQLLDEPDFIPGMPVIWDLSQALIDDLGPDDFLQIIGHIKGQAERRGSGYKIALVASADLQFGLSRMFSAYGDREALPIGVYRDIEAAKAWASA